MKSSVENIRICSVRRKFSILSSAPESSHGYSSSPWYTSCVLLKSRKWISSGYCVVLKYRPYRLYSTSTVVTSGTSSSSICQKMKHLHHPPLRLLARNPGNRAAASPIMVVLLTPQAAAAQVKPPYALRSHRWMEAPRKIFPQQSDSRWYPCARTASASPNTNGHLSQASSATFQPFSSTVPLHYTLHIYTTLYSTALQYVPSYVVPT